LQQSPSVAKQYGNNMPFAVFCSYLWQACHEMICKWCGSIWLNEMRVDSSNGCDFSGM